MHTIPFRSQIHVPKDAQPGKMSCMRTTTCGGRLLHDPKGNGTLERVRHLNILQVFRHYQRRRPVHFLMPMIPVPKHSNVATVTL